MKITMGVIGVFILGGCSAAPMKTVTPSHPHASSVERVLTNAPSPRVRELAVHALNQIGVPYRFGGSSPDQGFDCSGLVQYVFHHGAGLALPRNTQAMSRVGTSVARGELEPGDLVFFDTLRRPYSHVGIYLGEHRFIHAPTRRGSVEVVDMRERYWQTRFNGARRLDL